MKQFDSRFTSARKKAISIYDRLQKATCKQKQPMNYPSYEQQSGV